MSPFTIRPATLSDLDGLATIEARAFHPVNPYHVVAIPDTPKVRDWWKQIFTHCIVHEEYKLLVASATTSSNDSENGGILGVLLLHYIVPGQTTIDESCWTLYPPTDDHDKEKYLAMVGADEEMKAKLGATESTSASVPASGRKPYWQIEFFGTDYEWKGKGIGTALLGRRARLRMRGR